MLRHVKRAPNDIKRQEKNIREIFGLGWVCVLCFARKPSVNFLCRGWNNKSQNPTTKHFVNTRSESIFSDPGVARELSRLHENFVILPADKASNNYTFVCKRHYVDILIEELGFHSLHGSPTYNLTDFSASEVLDNHKLVLTIFGIRANSEQLDLPYIYWIPKMHKNPYKHRFIAGSSKCST